MTKNQMMTAGAVAFAGFAAWFALRKTGALPETGEQQRMAGVADLFAQNKAQEAATNAAIAKQWGSMGSLFATQPDFYV